MMATAIGPKKSLRDSGTIASISTAAAKVDGVQTVPWTLASGESRQLDVQLAR